MRTVASVIILLGALALAPGASIATHEGPDATCTLDDAPGEVVAIGDDPSTDADEGTLYVNVREEPALDVRLYIEDNGIEDLQTGGANPSQELLDEGYTDSGWQDLCGHDSDMLIL